MHAVGDRYARPHTSSEEQRRRLLTVVVEDYGDGDTDYVQGVKEQLRSVHAWWCDSDLGERRFIPEPAVPLGTRDDVETFLRTTALRDASPTDVLVMYITGHGVNGTGSSHFLQLPHTDTQRLVATGYRTADLVLAALDSHAGHVLVIVNTCHAGRINAEVATFSEEITLRRRHAAHLAVLVTADAREPVAVREMGVLLDRVQEQLRTTAGIAGPYLTVEEFLAELNRAATRYPHARLCLPTQLLPAWGGVQRPTLCLPNPGYRQPDDLVAPARRQVAVPRGEMDYWIARASGRTSDIDHGWYFAGRARLTRVIADFLTAATPGTLLVTGVAGSGKSAVIARAVTLSDPGFRDDLRYRAAVSDAPADTVPPPGAVDAAVLARNKEDSHILADIITALGHQPLASLGGQDHMEALRTQLLRILMQAERTTTLVIDGFDEAAAPYDLITQIIAPLAHLTWPDATPGLRLVIGVRSTRPEADATPDTVGLLRLLTDALSAHTAPLMVRTDTPAESPGDIARYLDALLAETPDVDSGITAYIARRTTPSFLDARIAAEQLRAANHPARLAADPTWRSSLHQGTTGLLRQDILDTAADDLPPTTVLALLRAAAFAPGAGIPWADIWPAVGQAVLGEDIPDPDSAITRLLNSRLAGYLTQDSEDGRTVYRPVHERLADVLRTDPHDLLPLPGEPGDPT